MVRIHYIWTVIITHMRRFIVKYWWLFPVILACLLILMGLLFTTIPSILDTIVGILLLIAVLALLGSWIILLVYKQWWKCFLSVALSILVICVMYFPLVMGSMTAPDGFGRKHPIPEGMDYSTPIDRSVDDYNRNTFSTVIVDSLDTSSYLQIWGKHGGYYYDFYYSELPAGSIFLRCFEATDNIALSKDRVADYSSVQIDSSHCFTQLVNKKPFTVYEGDWDDYYAARIEVWHKNAATQEEIKLLEKVYRIEGYMR